MSAIDQDAVYRAVLTAFGSGYLSQHIQQEIYAVAYEWRRPCVVFKPIVFPDGDQWCALLGDDLMTGVSGFGSTPEEAAAAFDQAWWKGKTPMAVRQEHLIKEEEARQERENNGQFGVGA